MERQEPMATGAEADCDHSAGERAFWARAIGESRGEPAMMVEVSVRSGAPTCVMGGAPKTRAGKSTRGRRVERGLQSQPVSYRAALQSKVAEGCALGEGVVGVV